MNGSIYDVFAIQYAKALRPSSDYFLNSDPHDGLRPIFYYIWLIRNCERSIVVDTGFSEDRARARRRDFMRCPADALRVLGVSAAEVKSVILTHLHYDHAGNLDKFPSARFVVQDDEIAFATGRAMRFKVMQNPFELKDVQDIVAYNYEGRVHFVRGSEQIAPGVHVHHVPGHSRGLQAVTVETARGTLCLASDAAHFFDNISQANPFPIVTDVTAALEGHEIVKRFGATPDHVIPGHDPEVAALYPAVSGDPHIFQVSEAPLRSPLGFA